MQSTQPPQTAAATEGLAQNQSSLTQQAAQPAGSAPSSGLPHNVNLYQQQLEQQLQQQLLPRARLNIGNQPPFEFPAHLSTPEQRYQALLQRHQQSAPQQEGFTLDSFVHALGSHQAAQSNPPSSHHQLQQLVPSLAAHWQSGPAQTAALTQQSSAQAQSAKSQQPVLTRFSGPASSSFQPYALTSRIGFQQPATQAAPAVQARAQAQPHNVAQPAQAARPMPTPRPFSSSTALANPVASANTGTPSAPRPVSSQAAPLAVQPAAAGAVSTQRIEPETASPNNGFDEVPHVLNPPPSGKVVWAKLARYPWWPAEVLDMMHSYIPEGEEPPRLGAVPVRFFGTYSFSWIESKRAIEPFDEEHLEHAANSRLPEFQRGVTEAKHFQLTGELPHGFTVTLQESFAEQEKAKAKAAAKGGKQVDDQKDPNSKGNRKSGGKRQYSDPVAAEHARHRAVTARRLRILRHLGLSPPAGSPFATASAVCLDGFGPFAAQLGYVPRADT